MCCIKYEVCCSNFCVKCFDRELLCFFSEIFLMCCRKIVVNVKYLCAEYSRDGLTFVFSPDNIILSARLG